MTVIGKILTFLCFFMSLVFLGFAITINQLNKDPEKKQSWRETALEHKKAAEKAAEDVRSIQTKLDDANTALAQVEGQIRSEKEASAKEVTAAKVKAQQAEAKYNEIQTQFSNVQIAADTAAKELEHRRKEVVSLQGEIRDRNLQLANKDADITRLKNERIQAVLARDSYLDRLKALEKEYRQVFKDLERMREQATVGGAASTRGEQQVVLTPPPEDVQGLVKEVLGKERLVSITIGSDDGISKGHTLEVYRLDPEPEYVGIIKIEEVRPDEAVGRIIRERRPIQPKDRVAGSVLPKR